jgi:hypothetical protein
MCVHELRFCGRVCVGKLCFCTFLIHCTSQGLQEAKDLWAKARRTTTEMLKSHCQLMASVINAELIFGSSKEWMDAFLEGYWNFEDYTPMEIKGKFGETPPLASLDAVQQQSYYSCSDLAPDRSQSRVICFLCAHLAC